MIYVVHRGLIILTGCSHPGIDKIIEYAHNLTGLPVYAVIGGFHLVGADDSRLREVALTFKRYGLREVYPIHCTGDRARRYFKEVLGEVYEDGHVGIIVEIGAP